MRARVRGRVSVRVRLPNPNPNPNPNLNPISLEAAARQHRALYLAHISPPISHISPLSPSRLLRGNTAPLKHRNTHELQGRSLSEMPLAELEARDICTRFPSYHPGARYLVTPSQVT